MIIIIKIIVIVITAYTMGLTHGLENNDPIGERKKLADYIRLIVYFGFITILFLGGIK